MLDNQDPAAAYELQATACLAAAEAHQERLLSVAERLAGTPEGGMELYQEAVLRCHDMIQSKGFHGDHFEFYLLKTIRNLAFPSQQKAQLRTVPLSPTLELSTPATEAPATDAVAHLAEQVSAEAQARFGMADRVALRLHAEGYSFQQISEMTTGGDQSWIRRRVNKMKNHLRAAFGRAWANLEA
ncbi:sigma factor [Hymenobacter sp. M29]|uniref:Sigma factor n=1 Tax=Hymenobacter mellowenesis TaxID=3063995 RepID=A0ABT9AA80_9BACT|nr:sigma factor [Hymenobacter sp. M29]MDO7846468.1 sigma factor [Hymenobacter sp. M29]